MMLMVSLFFVGDAFGQGVMGRWEMCGLSGVTSGSVSSTGVVANVSFSVLSRGAGLTAQSATNGYNSSTWSTSGSLDINQNDYYEFTITPAAGFKISIASIKVRDQVSTTNSSFDAYLRYGDNTYTSDLANWQPSTTLTNRTINLTGVAALQNRSTPVTFRIYGSDADASNTTYRLDCEGTGVGQARGVDINGIVSVTSSMVFYANGSFVVPSGVTTVNVQAWGAGGGGSTITSTGARGGGGGGGAYASGDVAVNQAGSPYPVVVGAGGGANSNGGSSTFNSTSIVAAGGTGGTNNSTTGGAGGTLLNSTGTIRNPGGSGANGGGTSSGGGGGGAGTTNSGGNASGATAGAGTTLYGGSGGAGVSGSLDGNTGNFFGGGGSGAVTNSTQDRTGGSGEDGAVIISWTCPTYNISSISGITPICSNPGSS